MQAIFSRSHALEKAIRSRVQLSKGHCQIDPDAKIESGLAVLVANALSVLMKPSKLLLLLLPMQAMGATERLVLYF